MEPSEVVARALELGWEASEAPFQPGILLRAGAIADPEGTPLYLRADFEEQMEILSPTILPAFWDWAEQGVVHPVRHQGESASCISHAACCVAESRRRIAGLGEATLAPRTLHLCLMKRDFAQGTNRVWLLETLRALGLPIDTGVDADLTSKSECQPISKTTRLPLAGFADLPDVAAVKREIANRGPIVAHMIAHEDFFRHYTNTYDVYQTDPQSPVVGEHAVCITGYDDPTGCWIGLNSLGDQWGHGGLFRIAYADFASQLFAAGKPAYALETG